MRGGSKVDVLSIFRVRIVLVGSLHRTRSGLRQRPPRRRSLDWGQGVVEHPVADLKTCLLSLHDIRHAVDASPDTAHADFHSGVGQLMVSSGLAGQTVRPDAGCDVVCPEVAGKQARGRPCEGAVRRRVCRVCGRLHIGDESRFELQVCVGLRVSLAQRSLRPPLEKNRTSFPTKKSRRRRSQS